MEILAGNYILYYFRMAYLFLNIFSNLSSLILILFDNLVLLILQILII